MPIPDYETIMLPLLELIQDGKEYSLRDAVSILADKFKLSEAERKELLPSGQQPIFHNRVGWAKTYLKKAGLYANYRARQGSTQPKTATHRRNFPEAV